MYSILFTPNITQYSLNNLYLSIEWSLGKVISISIEWLINWTWSTIRIKGTFYSFQHFIIGWGLILCRAVSNKWLV